MSISKDIEDLADAIGDAEYAINNIAPKVKALEQKEKERSKEKEKEVIGFKYYNYNTKRIEDRQKAEEDLRSEVYAFMDCNKQNFTQYEWSTWDIIHNNLCALAGYYEEKHGINCWKH